MKSVRSVLVLIALCVVAAAQSNSNPAAEQRYFNLEDSVQNRVDLGDAELAALADDDLMRNFVRTLRAKAHAGGIEATVVHLCGSGERDLIAIGNGGDWKTPTSGRSGLFAICRRVRNRAQRNSLGLTIDTKRSNKCLNIESTTAPPSKSNHGIPFQRREVRRLRQKSKKLGQ